MMSNRGNIVRSLLSGGVILLWLVGLAAVVAPVDASHIDIEARREERRLAREARRAEREAEKVAEEIGEPTCDCSATLRFSRPSLHFGGGGLVFTPRVDMTVRGRGEVDAPALNVGVHYEGNANGTAFSGEKAVTRGTACNGRYSFGGLELMSITLPGLGFGALSDDEEVDGTVRLNASLVGCGFEEEHKQFGFTREGYGELSVGSWRSVR